MCVDLPGCFGRMKAEENRIFPSEERLGLLTTVDTGAGIASAGISSPLPSGTVESARLWCSLYFLRSGQFLWQER